APCLRAGERATALRGGADLIDHLPHCRRLWVVDACVGGDPPGTVARWRWPVAVNLPGGRASSHGFGLADALRLAEQMGSLPASVVLLTVDIGRTPLPEESLSPPVAQSIAILETQWRRETALSLRELQSMPDRIVLHMPDRWEAAANDA
ncbi:MAG: hydrogenase maturation protease, partial [Planctomycetales bacterium]|nr:hydrogenase maturation protease [Planctomycetales bacterium]